MKKETKTISQVTRSMMLLGAYPGEEMQIKLSLYTRGTTGGDWYIGQDEASPHLILGRQSKV